jgi:hypothetical protein
LWARAQAVRIAGADTLTLGREDFLLHLCLHATRHLTRDWDDVTVLKGICDLATALKHWAADVNWDAVDQRASAWRARNAVYVMLHLARQWFGADVPEPVLAALRPADVTDEHLQWVRERILGSAGPTDEKVGDHAAEFVTAHGMRAKTAVVWHQAFPGRRRLARELGLPETSWRVYAGYPKYAASRLAHAIRVGWRLLRRGDAVAGPAQRVAQNVKLRAWLQASGR